MQVNYDGHTIFLVSLGKSHFILYYVDTADATAEDEARTIGGGMPTFMWVGKCLIGNEKRVEGGKGRSVFALAVFRIAKINQR